MSYTDIYDTATTEWACSGTSKDDVQAQISTFVLSIPGSLIVNTRTYSQVVLGITQWYGKVNYYKRTIG